MGSKTVTQDKTLAFVSYLTIFGFIVAYFLNQKKNTFANFHIRQSLGLWLSFIFSGIVISTMNNLNVTLGLWLFFGVLFLYAMFCAITGKAIPIPILGKLFQKWFINIIK